MTTFTPKIHFFLKDMEGNTVIVIVQFCAQFSSRVTHLLIMRVSCSILSPATFLHEERFF